MRDLEELASLCLEVSVTINPHRCEYATVEEYFTRYDGKLHSDVPNELLPQMIARDRVVCVQFYPETPIGFHLVHGLDIDETIGRALRLRKQEPEGE